MIDSCSPGPVSRASAGLSATAGHRELPATVVPGQKYRGSISARWREGLTAPASVVFALTAKRAVWPKPTPSATRPERSRPERSGPECSGPWSCRSTTSSMVNMKSS